MVCTLLIQHSSDQLDFLKGNPINEVLAAFANHVCARSELRYPTVHHELQADLVKNIWTQFGMFRD
ncbi:hypothetical protein MtrunA17_Chr3g0099691 [Medicago truncatula]|uniref:Uncharacterized protein n=1 Tax=Medicago truncatula TaxID=3880 RepID=A0A396IW45_MEDTR|nr:hypothetical protein MtrunA17_Chr3g0099691 [Medicago truncatula]